MLALLIIQKPLLEVEAFKGYPDLANLLGRGYTKISPNTNYQKSGNGLHKAIKNMSGVPRFCRPSEREPDVVVIPKASIPTFNF